MRFLGHFLGTYRFLRKFEWFHVSRSELDVEIWSPVPFFFVSSMNEFQKMWPIIDTGANMARWNCTKIEINISKIKIYMVVYAVATGVQKNTKLPPVSMIGHIFWNSLIEETKKNGTGDHISTPSSLLLTWNYSNSRKKRHVPRKWPRNRIFHHKWSYLFLVKNVFYTSLVFWAKKNWKKKTFPKRWYNSHGFTLKQ